MKGDRVEIVVDGGDGTRVYEIDARRAGRRVETTTGRGIVEVTEVTRSGTAVRTARFMASRVIAVVEHPARDTGDGGAPATTGRDSKGGQDARLASAS
jgi:hypothetical protein